MISPTQRSYSFIYVPPAYPPLDKVIGSELKIDSPEYRFCFSQQFQGKELQRSYLLHLLKTYYVEDLAQLPDFSQQSEDYKTMLAFCRNQVSNINSSNSFSSDALVDNKISAHCSFHGGKLKITLRRHRCCVLI